MNGNNSQFEGKNRFNDLGSTTQTPKTLIKLLILQSKYNLEEAIETYYSKHYSGVDASLQLNYIRSRLHTFFYQVKYMMEGKKGKEELKKLKDKIDNVDPEDVFDVIDELFRFIYSIDLTKIDYEKQDSTNASEEDNRKGLG